MQIHAKGRMVATWRNAGTNWTLLGCAVIAFGTVLLAGTASAQQVDLGFRTYKEKVECGRCHGWSGDGVQDDPRAPKGADLRKTTLDRDGLIEVIKCGRPNSEMPHFDERAYSDKRCYGVTAADLGKGAPPFSGIPLIGREIEGLADYLMAKVVGKGAPKRKECEEFYGNGSTACSDLPAGN